MSKDKGVKYDGTQGSVVDIIRQGNFVGQPEEGGLELHTERGVFPVRIGDTVVDGNVEAGFSRGSFVIMDDDLEHRIYI